ncbi:MAG: NepR family anti-sigma factor [Glycocaulis sp.]
MPDPALGTSSRAEAGQSARRRVLGDQLRAYYDAVTSEPVPDALTDLMAELARKSSNTPAEGGDSGRDSDDGA